MKSNIWLLILTAQRIFSILTFFDYDINHYDYINFIIYVFHLEIWHALILYGGGSNI